MGMKLCKCGCGQPVIEFRGRIADFIRGHNLRQRKKRSPLLEQLNWVWRGMIQRCYRPSHISYPNYGARGITVCELWLESREAFFEWALSNGFQPGLEIDRKNNDGNYEPGNCRWATSAENSRNKRNNRLLTCFGETKTVTDWEADSRCSVSRFNLCRRLEMGWEPERAITEAHFASSSNANHCRALGMEVYAEAIRLVEIGLSYKQVAGRLGVSDRFVSLAHRGKTWHSRMPLFAPQEQARQAELFKEPA